MSTGARIRHYRLKLRWTLDDLEEASGVASGSISALELRDSRKSSFFPAIAKAFGLTLEQLYDTNVDWPVVDTRKAALYAEKPRTPPSIANSPGDGFRAHYTREVIDMLNSLPEADLRGAVASLRAYVQNLGPPQNGQNTQMAA